MLPSLATTLITATVACGACVDQKLVSRLPFLGWWVLAFVGWSLLIGPLVFSYVNAQSATDLKNPARLFLVLLVLLVVSMFITGGSLMLPFVLLVPFWLLALLRGIFCHSSGWSRFCITVASALILIVPLSYLFRGEAPAPIHTTRAPAPAAVPTAKPATVPGTPTAASDRSPTLQDALQSSQPRIP